MKFQYHGLCILLLVLAFGSNYYSATIPLESREVAHLVNGQIVKTDLLVEPTSARMSELLSVFLFTLGAAIFVSVMVTSRMETASVADEARRLKQIQDAVNIDVFETLFKKIIPEEVFAAVRDGIIQNRIIRRDMNLIFDFFEDAEGIGLRQTFRFDILNTSTEPIENPLCVIQDDSVPEDDLESADFRINGSIVAKFRRDDSEQSHGLEIKRLGPHERATSLSFSIPALSVVHAQLIFRMKFSGRDVHDAFFTNYPVINMNLVANFPPTYEFQIFQALSTPMQCTHSGKRRVMFEGKGGILPQQGFAFLLRRKAEPAMEGGSALTPDNGEAIPDPHADPGPAGRPYPVATPASESAPHSPATPGPEGSLEPDSVANLTKASEPSATPPPEPRGPQEGDGSGAL